MELKAPTQIAADSRLLMHPMVSRAEPGRRPLLGCTHSRKFLEVSTEALTAARLLGEGKSVGETESLLRASFGHEFDVATFAQLLSDRGFVKTIDGKEIETAVDARTRHPVLHSIPASRLAWLRSPFLLVPAAALVLAWLAALIAMPELRIGSHDMNLTGRPGLNMVLVFGGLLVMAYVHELAHFFVARSYGVDATISFSHRFYMMVLHTDVSNAWVLPRRQKLAIFLAGIAFNLTAAAGLSIASLATSGFTTDVLRYLTVLNTFPLVFQLFVFARTDLYHVALALTGERNLARDSVSILKHRLRRRFALLRGRGSATCRSCSARTHGSDPFCFTCGQVRETDQSRFTFEFRNRRLLTSWGVIQVVGTVWGMFMMVVLALPASMHNLGLGWGLLLSSSSPFGIGEAVLAILLVGLQFAFLAYFVLKLIGKGLLFVFLLGVRRGIPWMLRRMKPESLSKLVATVIALAYPVLAERGFLPGLEETQRRAKQAAAQSPPTLPSSSTNHGREPHASNN